MNPQMLIFAGDSIALFTLDAQTFVNMIPPMFNFFAVVAALNYFLHKPVSKILQARAERVANDIETAAASKTDAEKLKADYEQKVRDIDVKRAEELEKARKEAIARRDQIVEEAKAEAQELKSRATRDITAERDRVKAEVHQAIVDISAEMAAKLIAVTIDKNAHEKLFAEALTELETTAFRPLEHVV